MAINNQEILIDGYDPGTSTIYQFYGCKWHGCPCLRTTNDRYHQMMAIENQFQSLGYNVVLVWECSHPELSIYQLDREFVPYLHFIVYDFKVKLLKKDLSVTSDLMINSFHIPISVMISYSLTHKPIFLHNQDLDQLIKEFVVDLVRWQEVICDEVTEMYLMVDEGSLPSQV